MQRGHSLDGVVDVTATTPVISKNAPVFESWIRQTTASSRKVRFVRNAVHAIRMRRRRLRNHGRPRLRAIERRSTRADSSPVVSRARCCIWRIVIVRSMT